MNSTIKTLISNKFGNSKVLDVEPIVDDILSVDPRLEGFLEDFIKREVANDFFDINHFDKTFEYKNILTEKNSTKVSQLLSCLYEKEGLENFELTTGEFSQNEVNAAVGDLQKHGFHILPRKLPRQWCKNLLNNLDDVNFLGAQTLDTVRGFSKDTIIKSKDSLYRVKDQNELMEKDIFRKVSFDRFFLSVAQDYLFSPPIHVQTNFWWTRAQENPDERELSANAQLFHRDKEYIRFLKVFVYLNDVNEQNGSHEFIPDSHLSHPSFYGEGEDAARRFSKEELSKQEYLRHPISHIGGMGTVVFEDTYGFHRGGLVHSGYRLMFQLEYANSLLFRYAPPFDPSLIDLNQLDHKSSRIFANYSDRNRKKLRQKEKRDLWFHKNKARVRKLLRR